MKLTEQGLEQLIQLVKDNQSIYELEYIDKLNKIVLWRNDMNYVIYPRANATEISVDVIDPYCDSYFDSVCYDIWKLSDVLELIRPYIKKAE